MAYVYQITNIITQDSYVGKTKQSLNRRWRKHLLNSKDGKTHLYRAIRKYGISNFRVDIIEETDAPDERERFHITTLKPKYNMTCGGDGGDTSSSKNFKKAMKKYHARKPKSEYATYGMLGKKQSETQQAAIKKSNSCPVMCDGVLFESVGKAQESYPGISIRKRLDSKKYPTFYRMRKKTVRKLLIV